MLVLQQLINLSDAEVEFQVNAQLSLVNYVGLGVMNDIPDATTMDFFRERHRMANVIDKPFEIFESYLRDQGLEARGGQIIDATLNLVPNQHSCRQENKEINANHLPDGWIESLKRLQQRDLDACWVKSDIHHYCY